MSAFHPARTLVRAAGHRSGCGSPAVGSELPKRLRRTLFRAGFDGVREVIGAPMPSPPTAVRIRTIARPNASAAVDCAKYWRLSTSQNAVLEAEQVRFSRSPGVWHD
jgi:hypothetical protein